MQHSGKGENKVAWTCLHGQREPIRGNKQPSRNFEAWYCTLKIESAEFTAKILFGHTVANQHSFLPVVAVALRQDEREEELEDDFAVVDAVAGHVRHEPVPKLGQSPEKRTKNNTISPIVWHLEGRLNCHSKWFVTTSGHFTQIINCYKCHIKPFYSTSNWIVIVLSFPCRSMRKTKLGTWKTA